MAIAALVTSIIYFRRQTSLQILTFYITFSLIQTAGDCYYSTAAADEHWRRHVDIFFSDLFMVLEFSVCNLLILRSLHSTLRRRIVRANCLLFFGLLLFIAVRLNRRFLDGTFFFFESAFLLLPCLVYFYDLFITASLRPLKDQPSFWVMTGMLFLNACSIPLISLEMLGNSAKPYFTLNYVLYIVLFILIIRAYLCPTDKVSEATG
jgi:hypothetical protein